MQYSRFSKAVCLLGSQPCRWWCEWVKEEERDKPGWRSLELVSVPAACGLLSSNRERSVMLGKLGSGTEEGWGGVRWGSLPFTVHQTPETSQQICRSDFYLPLPKAIRQFSWETAAKIYICLSVSTYQLSSVCVLPLVDSIFKSSVSISVWC